MNFTGKKHFLNFNHLYVKYISLEKHKKTLIKYLECMNFKKQCNKHNKIKHNLIK